METPEASHERLGAAVEPDRDGLVRSLASGSLPECLHAAALLAPDRPALAVGGETMTLGQLDARSASVAGWLREHDVMPGDRVLLAATTSMALVLAYLGTLRAQATAVPLDATLGAEELEWIVADAEPAAAFADGQAHERLAGMAAGPRVLADLGGGLAGLPGASRLPLGGAVAPMMIAYTSGTTGRPKGAVLSHGNVLASIRGAMAAWRWTPADVLVHCLPLSHQHGLSGVHATLLAGSRAVICPRFDAAELCATIARERASVLFAVPAIYARLDAWDGIDAADLSSLRLATSGSAALAPELAERAARWLGRPPLERYGSTEGGLNLSAPYDGRRTPGRVGTPLPGIEAAVVDPEGNELAAGQEGELVVRGPQVFGGYWRRPEADAAAFLGDGWLRTGDIARIEDNGEVTITGRLKELIITGGINVHPREVERVLEQHEAVRQVAVAGVPSERWGEEIVAFVVGAEVDEQDVIAFSRERLAPFKCPKRVVVVGELPVGPLGKVQRHRLVELVVPGPGTKHHKEN